MTSENPPRLRVPRVVATLAQQCADRGGRAYAVGGCVRDFLMHRPVNDFDVEVFGIPEADLAALLRGLGRVDAVGRSFAVFKLRAGGMDIDVSLPRRDSKVGPGHRGIAVVGDPAMSIAEAASRRDLTVNAMLYDLLAHTIEDPWGGRADLAAGRLRAVDEDTFLEDPLRALRVVQFAARLGFTPDASLVALCRRAPLAELPPERVHDEWRKLLMDGIRPDLGLAAARDGDLLARVFPEVVDRPTVDEALARLVATGDGSGREYAVRLATWLHATPPPAIEATLDRLGLHRWGGYPVRRAVLEVAAAHDAPMDTDAALRHLACRAEVHATLRTRWAVTGDDAVLDRLDRARALGVAFEPEPRRFQGRDALAMGIPPGPHLGVLLDHVYRLQLDGTLTTPEALATEAARWWAASGA